MSASLCRRLAGARRIVLRTGRIVGWGNVGCPLAPLAQGRCAINGILPGFAGPLPFNARSLDASLSLEGGGSELLRSKGLRCPEAQNIIKPPGSFDPALGRYRDRILKCRRDLLLRVLAISAR
jgi:hypothetical protein